MSTVPVLCKRLRYPFASAEVTVSADWELQWDQAGLVLFVGAPPGQNRLAAPSNDGAPPPYSPTPLWVKVGLELYNESFNATSCVSTTPDSVDWSRSRLRDYHASRLDLRVRLERVGRGLWLHYEDGSHGWVKIRELNQFFRDVEDKLVWVGVYVSRPANPPITRDSGQHLDSHLYVDFHGLEIHENEGWEGIIEERTTN